MTDYCPMGKELGGLEIPDFRDLNLYLLASWVQRYYHVEGKMWKDIIDHKYAHNSPNLFCYEDRSSPFWKGVLWAAKIAKMGYRFQVWNGKKIIFWEDYWFGSCSLAIQCWSLYSIVNEHGKDICEVWDGGNLRFTFKRIVDHVVMNQWHELLGIAGTLNLGDEEDAIIWQYNSSGIYSV
jgi:hypothetical protein